MDDPYFTAKKVSNISKLRIIERKKNVDIFLQNFDSLLKFYTLSKGKMDSH